MDNLTIKGGSNGIYVYINSGTSENIKNELLNRIQKAKEFFYGSKIYFVDMQSVFSDISYIELEKSFKEQFNITLLKSKDEFDNKTDKIFSGIHEGRTKFLKNTIRSGQKIEYHGNIVIIGDVNSGAEIVATGNIIILGVLRGIAHAGSNGNRKAIVAAYNLKPQQLRIDNIIARAPDDLEQTPKIPEIAKIKENSIIIEPYLPNKYL